MIRLTLLGAALLACASCLPALSASSDDEKPATKGPYMEVVTPDDVTPRGLVLAGPHAGYELGTGSIVRDLGETLRAPAVLAHDYRDPARGRFINVNRPTECPVGEDGKRSPEETTPTGNHTFEEWVRRVVEAKKVAGVDGDERIGLYVEIHGHRRKVNGERSAVPVIEVATVGFPEKALRKALARWDEERARDPKLPALVFDLTHPRYPHGGHPIAFRYRASGAKTIGILQSRYVKRALHFELPPGARQKGPGRRAVTGALARLIESSLGS